MRWYTRNLRSMAESARNRARERRIALSAAEGAGGTGNRHGLRGGRKGEFPPPRCDAHNGLQDEGESPPRLAHQPKISLTFSKKLREMGPGQSPESARN